METILIVDDEKNYLLVLSAVLEDEGYEVLTALNGSEALEIQKRSDLDLILTDMKMPGMSGIELLENIKAFTGEDYEVAHVPPAARAVLKRFDERSQHYELIEELSY